MFFDEKERKGKEKKRKTNQEDAKDSLFSDLGSDTGEASVDEGEDGLHDVEAHDTERGVDGTSGEDDRVRVADHVRVFEDGGKEVEVLDGGADDLRDIDVLITDEIEEDIEEEHSVADLGH